jgi:hypothetical protein
LYVGAIVEFHIRFSNLSDSHYVFLNGFRTWSPDGASWSYPAECTIVDSNPPPCGHFPDPPCYDTIVAPVWTNPVFANLFPYGNFWHDLRSFDGIGADTVGWVGVEYSENLGILPWYDDIVFAFPVKLSVLDTGKTICVDSSFWTPDNYWTWATIDFGHKFPPTWSGQRCYTITTKCCRGGVTGNIDYDPDDLVDIGDVTALISYLYIPPNLVPFCFDEANVDVDEEGLIDIGDLTALISYLYIPPNPLAAPCP